MNDLRFPFNEQALALWLRDTLAIALGPLEVSQFPGGQSNPTYLVTAGGENLVLRRKPPGELLPSAHAVEREYRVMKALADSGVPVPQMLGCCEDPAVIGTAFFVMEYLPGRIFWDPALPDLAPPEREAAYADSVRVLAALHNVDYAALGLANFGKPGSYFVRQIERWTKQYRASETERIEPMDQLIGWLPANIPPGDETTLVHGDYRIDNLVFHPTEQRIIGVVDWELSTLGHPLADFTYHLMAWRLPRSLFHGLRGLGLSARGIPEEDAYVAKYCRLTGRDGLPNRDFYVAYNLFRLAGILQGVMARSLAGNASSVRAREMGALARPVAESGWNTLKEAGLV